MRTLIVMMVMALVLSAGLSYADEITITIPGIDTSLFPTEETIKEIAVSVQSVRSKENMVANAKNCQTGYRTAHDGKKAGTYVENCKDGYEAQPEPIERFFFELAPEVTVTVREVEVGEKILVGMSVLANTEPYNNDHIRCNWEVTARPTITLEPGQWKAHFTADEKTVEFVDALNKGGAR